MNRVDPKQAAIFVGVLVVIASIINSTQDFRQRAGSRQTGLQQPLPQPQQQNPVRNEGVSQGAVEGAAAASGKAAADAAAEHARYLARYLNSGYTRKPGIKTVAIVVVSEDGKLNRAVATVVASRFKTNSVRILPSFFKPEFVSDGLLNDAFTDSGRIFNKLELANSLDGLLLARQKVQYSTDASLNNVITANMKLELAVFPADAAAERPTWTFTANGADFKREDARKMAEERLIKQIAGDTKMSFSLIFTANQNQ